MNGRLFLISRGSTFRGKAESSFLQVSIENFVNMQIPISTILNEGSGLGMASSGLSTQKIFKDLLICNKPPHHCPNLTVFRRFGYKHMSLE